METKDGNVTASIEEITEYNMLLTEAIFEVLADKNILNREEIMERVRELKGKTKVNFRRPN